MESRDPKKPKKPKDRGEETDKRPDFDCEFDPDTGQIDEPCVTDYLESNMPKSV